MALGGGLWTTQNKTLPGAYINFVSKDSASASLSDRGYAAMPLELGWGPGGEVITVTNEDFIKNSLKVLGYAYDADELKGLRDLFTNADTLYTYRLNSGGTKAGSDFGTAKYEGALGNTICNVVTISDYIEDTVNAVDYTTGTYTGPYTLDSYFSMSMASNHIFTIDSQSRTINGRTFTRRFNTQGTIQVSENGAIYRALKVNMPADGTLTVYYCVPSASGNVVVWNENGEEVYSVTPSDTNGDVFETELSKGTYYIGRDSGSCYIFEASFVCNVYNVKTIFNGEEVEEQTAGNISELESDYIDYSDSAELYETAGLYMTGGTDGSSASATAHQKALNALESYSFNTLGCVSDDDIIKKLYAEYTERLRDEVGLKFQCVVFGYEADYEGVINLVTSVKDGDAGNELVYWVTGASAGCAVNKSLTNSVYDGEYDVYTDYTQTELTAFVTGGKFALHKVGDDVRVLVDINSLVETTSEKGDIFKENQTIRVCDQIANDIADIFNTSYLGKVPNDAAGRSAFKAEIVKHHNQLMDLRAIEDFESDDVTVEQGDTKRSVVVTDNITVVNAMEQLYMTVVVA